MSYDAAWLKKTREKEKKIVLYPKDDTLSKNCVFLLSRVQLFATPWTGAARLLCPWNSPGKNTGVGCHFLLQNILDNFPDIFIIP